MGYVPESVPGFSFPDTTIYYFHYLQQPSFCHIKEAVKVSERHISQVSMWGKLIENSVDFFLINSFTFTVDTGKEVGLSQYKHNVLCFSAIEASVADQSNKGLTRVKATSLGPMEREIDFKVYPFFFSSVEKSAVSATFCADVVKWLTPDKSSKVWCR